MNMYDVFIVRRGELLREKLPKELKKRMVKVLIWSIRDTEAMSLKGWKRL